MSGPQLAGLAPADPDPVSRAGTPLTGPRGSRTAGASSGQQRTFNLTARITAALKEFLHPGGQPADTDPSTLDTGTPSQGRTFAYQEYFRAENTRLQVYEDADEMDESTDEVAGALDTLADSAVNPEDGSQHTFVIEIDEGQYRDRAEAIFDQTTEALDLQRQSFSIARDFLKYGDCFVELVVDETRQLARAKILPANTVWRNEDQAGNLRDGIPVYDTDGHCKSSPGDCAFDQRERMNGGLIAAFNAWQIVHFRWNRRGSDRYGHSLLRTARLVWKKLRAAEEAIVVARLQRAWMRMVHYVDTTGMDAESARRFLMKYRQELTRKFIVDTQLRENPFEVTSDFFVAAGYMRDPTGQTHVEKKGKIETLQGDHGALATLTDIEYFQNKLFASLRVPKAYLGFERDINAKATLTTQDIQFARVLRRIQAVLSQGYKEIFDTALMLAGINPADVSYTVRWPAILVSDEERDAIIRMYHARADAVYWQMGAPSTKWLVQQRFGMDDEAWEADNLDAESDPEPRLKPAQLGMPAAQDVQGTGEQPDDGTGEPGQQAGQQTRQPPKSFSDVPPNDFDPKLPTATRRKAATNTPHRNSSRRDPLAANVMEEGDEEYDEGDFDFDFDLEDILGGDLALGDPLSPDGRPIRRRRRSRVFVPGMADGARRGYSRRTGHARELSVSGVHGLGPGVVSRRGRVMRPRSSEEVAAVAEDALSGFYVNLLARKRVAMGE